MAEKTIEEHAVDLHHATSLFLNYSVQYLIKQGVIHPSEKNALIREYSRLMAENTRENDRTSNDGTRATIFTFE